MRIGKLAIGTLLIFAASTVQAQTYTSQSSFLAAIQSGYYLETFDSLPGYNSVSSPMTFSQNGFSYSAAASSGLYGVTPDLGVPADHALSTNGSSDAITFTFTSGNITAVGGQFFQTAFDGTQTPGDATVTFNDGTTATLTATAGTPQPFFGYVSTVPILSLTVTVPQNFATVNNFIATPEPGSLALLVGMSVTGAGFLARRRHNARQAV